jgi:Mor family transcriptional regulator
VVSAALKRKMEEDGIERGEEMFLSTGGKSFKLKAGTSSGRGKRPKKPRKFSAKAAMELKKKLNLSHDAANKVIAVLVRSGNNLKRCCNVA